MEIVLSRLSCPFGFEIPRHSARGRVVEATSAETDCLILLSYALYKLIAGIYIRLRSCKKSEAFFVPEYRPILKQIVKLSIQHLKMHMNIILTTLTCTSSAWALNVDRAVTGPSPLEPRQAPAFGNCFFVDSGPCVDVGLCAAGKGVTACVSICSTHIRESS